MSDENQYPSNMVAIANPEQWAGIHVVDLGAVGDHGHFGHLIAVIAGPMLSKDSEWRDGKYERTMQHRTVAVMACTVDERLAMLEDQRNHTQAEYAHAQEHLRAAVKHAGEFEAKCQSLERELLAAKAASACARQTADQATDQLRRLEGDLAKVREVFGSKAYDEAVGKKT